MSEKIIELEKRIKYLEEEQQKDKTQIAFLMGFVQAGKVQLNK